MQKDFAGLHVVYASDDNFAEIMGVSLTSLYESNRDFEEITVYVLDSGICSENKDKINSLAAKYGRASIVWLTAVNISQTLNMDVALDRGSLSQYARLFVSSSLPESLERVLYLDCDIIIEQSLRELWSLDLKGNTIAALMDAFSKTYRQNIDLKPTDLMFNSGVMLIDLDKWKSTKAEGRLLDFIARKKGQIQQGDQGALNAVLSYETYCFDPKFNSETVFYDFTYKEMMIYRDPPEFYSEAEIKNAVENPVIIHFTTSFLSERPWIKGCDHVYTDRWLYFKSLSPWAESPLWEPKKPGRLKKLYLGFIKVMPRGFSVWFSGMLHRYGRPILFKIKNR